MENDFENNKNLNKISVEGDIYYETFLTKKYENKKKYEPFNDKKIYSYIPGTVLNVFVKESQKISKNDNIFEISAMKMDNIIKSPIDGIVKKIYVKKGEQVPKDHLILEFK